MSSMGRCGIIWLVVLMVNVMMVSSDVFTSMTRIKDMVINERSILNDINEALPAYRDVKSEFTRFYNQRIKDIETRNLTKEMERVTHPNGAYSIIREFATDYEDVRNKVFEANGDLANWYLAQIADQNDVLGARNSLLLLQEVYNLTTTDMVEGLYMRSRGPALNSFDAFLVGQAAFGDGRIKQCIEWLETALQMGQTESDAHAQKAVDHDDITNMAKIGPSSKTSGQQQLNTGQTMGLLGRCLLRVGDTKRAQHLYQDSKALDPYNGDVVTLGQELHHVEEYHEQKRSEEERAFHRLCAQHSKLTGKYTDHRLRCRTRAVYVPYYRFNEEIVSNRPYVSLFYNVISNREADHVKQYSKKKLYRGGVVGPAGNQLTTIRTSNIGFLEDHESPVVTSVSKRISQLTGLDTAINPSGFYSRKQSASEPLQVVNYGIGGYYSVHMDPYEHLNKDTEKVMRYSGNRLATFLVYLTDVEKGGSTAFPRADLVVPPSKRNAVFWYSYKPDGELDKLTRHAGCPVMVGEKWVINKWILTLGNMFTRRCGLTKTATQLDIDEDMINGYKPRKPISKPIKRQTNRRIRNKGSRK